MLLVGIDIGTTTICGVLFDRTNKRTILSNTIANHFINEKDATQSPEEILDKVLQIINIFISKAKNLKSEIRGLSISSQMHGILYVDEKGKAITPFYTWQNPWGSKPEVEQKISKILKFKVYTGYGIVTHLQNPHFDKNSKYFCNIGDYILMRLANNTIPITDISMAASMGIWNTENQSLIKEFSSEKYLFPKVISKPTVIGEFQGIKLVQAIGDNQASFLGSSKDLYRSLVLNYGTSGQLSFYSEHSLTLKGFEKRPLGNGYLYVAFSLSGGDSVKILANFFSEILNLCEAKSEISIYNALDKIDIAKVNNEGIIFKPYFLGKRGYVELNANITGIKKSNFHPKIILRALLEGVVKEIHEYYTLLPNEIKKTKDLLIGTGNGIKKNNNLKKIIEEIYKKNLKLSTVEEDSCIGAIIHLSVGLNLDNNYMEGIKFMKETNN
ncbi:MAG: FGGY family carbohydrate kinase [Sphaerochaetaceae bacterium]|nr:FGGY family carbohydrate kinase [Sphaerochaetaceae bacterium]MDC7236152.1 FGGY family carbohydrate kinase [Sphaerochaetaceae bacterium]